ncbi:MAG: M14 family zinc carboxypeptidase [Bacillota bacterium]|nr:M14 family zinc carboxypeptidase [Bacillota bacterium]
MMSKKPPEDWITQLPAISAIFAAAKRGRAGCCGRSAGGHPLCCIRYGERKLPTHRATYNSAVASGDPGNYRRRAGERPHVLIFAAIHGLELEGTAALMDLVHLLETGEVRGFDPADGQALLRLAESVTMTLIPIANPDGRMRHPELDAMLGLDLEKARYRMQGAWIDGSVAGWPEVKAVHPIVASRIKHLGAYFNDGGINPMHDSFPVLLCPENQALFRLVDAERPDFILSLHGGTNVTNHLVPPTFVPPYVLRHNAAINRALLAWSQKARLPLLDSFAELPADGAVRPGELDSFNLMSALHHYCGAVVLLYECNQGLAVIDTPQLDYAEMRLAHGGLFRVLLEHAVATAGQELRSFGARAGRRAAEP